MTEYVVKRNGEKVKYDAKKIVNAINSAILDVRGDKDKTIADEALSRVELYLSENYKDGEVPTVEDIQDLVEDSLIEIGYLDIAKEYIIYRNNRSKTRKNRKENWLLTDEFLSKYKHQPNPFPTELGEFIYYRTYSRWLSDEQRREYWWETVKRAVEYNASLAPTTKKEAEELFDGVYNFRNFLSGRTLWTGGTEASKKYPMSNYNCFTSDTEFITDEGIKSFDDFRDGEKVNILDGYSSFTKAEVKNFGEKDIYELVVNKGRSEKTYKVTDDHVWFVRETPNEKRYKEVQTKDLSIGDILRSSNYDNFSKGDIENTWKVKSVCSLNRKEETWCVTNSRTDSFTLDTGIHTHNCSFTVIDDFKAFEDLYYLLLIGSGVGVRVLEEDVEKMAPIRTDVKVHHDYYTAKPKEQRAEYTTYEFDDEKNVRIYIGDSKEGWVQSLKVFFELLTRHEYKPLENIYFNYDSVRPKGERLKTFGGTASGHQSVKRMFDKINNLLKNKNKNRTNLEPLGCLDIANMIGENVVSGGVRRTSEVGLFDVDDEDVKTAKNELYTQENGEWSINKDLEHRQMSNNSIYYKEKPSREQLSWHIKQMRYSGEPGFANAEEGHRRREDFNGANPCFTGDMKLLTQDGYKRFDELAKLNTRVNVVNKDGEVTDGNVWSNGVKDIVEVSFYNKDSIKCTPDHIFMTNEKEEVKAKDMKGKRIMPFVEQGFGFDNVAENAPYVKKVEYIGKEEVYDFSEPKTHWGVVEGAVVHNCMEILLDSKGVCNLVSLNTFAFVEDGELDLESILDAQKLNARSAYRMALVEFELPAWDYVNKRDRLIGLSLTGWQDMKNACDLTLDEEAEILRKLRDVAHESAEKIANEMNDVVPKLITTVKPEGTQTQMPTVSSGLHYSHSPYYIRRVRLNSDDPLVKVAEDLDWNVRNEVGQEGNDVTTKVIEFPVKAPDGKVKGDVSAIEQLETYKMFMENYVDHNASITVHVRDDEWEGVEEWIWNNWDSVFGISFLSYSDSFYDLMPYEEITEEEYRKMADGMDSFKPSLVNKYERKNQEERELDNDGCESGVCPVR